MEKGCAKVEIEPSCFIKPSDWQVALLPLQWVPGVLLCIFWHSPFYNTQKKLLFKFYWEYPEQLSIPVSLHNLMVSLLFSIWKPQNCTLTSLVIQAHCRISSTLKRCPGKNFEDTHRGKQPFSSHSYIPGTSIRMNTWNCYVETSSHFQTHWIVNPSSLFPNTPSKIQPGSFVHLIHMSVLTLKSLLLNDEEINSPSG